MNEPMTFLDFFSGVGGFRKGFELCGMVCKGHCEIDKFADRSYRAVHDVKEDEWYGEDITKTNPADLPRVNLWAGGFPCQDISVSGRQRGLAGERSSLFFEIIRLLIQGILYLPHDFEERVFRGDEAVFSLYATTDAFLYFEALQGASSRVMLAINDKYRPDEAVFLPPQGLLAVAMAKPINVEGTALYNYTEGYGSYLIPAVMMIIIFQTLLMVIGMVTGEEYSSKGIRAYTPFGYGWGVAIRIVAGKTSVYCALYAIFAFFLLGLLPHFFSIPNIGNGLYIVLLLIPYLMATSFLGLAASRYFTDSEAPLLMIAFFSVGLIFLSGVSYPMELMPWYWKVVHYIFPAALGTLAFVKLNSMGASMADIRPEYITLWIQALIYFTISIWVYKKKLESNLIS